MRRELACTALCDIGEVPKGYSITGQTLAIILGAFVYIVAGAYFDDFLNVESNILRYLNNGFLKRHQ